MNSATWDLASENEVDLCYFEVIRTALFIPIFTRSACLVWDILGRGVEIC